MGLRPPIQAKIIPEGEFDSKRRFWRMSLFNEDGTEFNGGGSSSGFILGDMIERNLITFEGQRSSPYDVLNANVAGGSLTPAAMPKVPIRPYDQTKDTEIIIDFFVNWVAGSNHEFAAYLEELVDGQIDEATGASTVSPLREAYLDRLYKSAVNSTQGGSVMTMRGIIHAGNVAHIVPGPVTAVTASISGWRERPIS